MELVGIFVALVVAFMIIGFVAALFQKDKDKGEDEDDTSVIISQEVPSVFDALNGNRKKR